VPALVASLPDPSQPRDRDSGRHHHIWCNAAKLRQEPCVPGPDRAKTACL